MATRILCLGNPLLADDAFGFMAAEELRRAWPQADIVETSAVGFDLLDLTLGASRLLVVDTFQTGAAPPGTVRIFRENDLQPEPGASPHYVGLFEALRLGKELALPVPQEVAIIAVEPADCRTVGGAMHPAVRAALPGVLELVRAMAPECASGARAAGRAIGRRPRRKTGAPRSRNPDRLSAPGRSA